MLMVHAMTQIVNRIPGKGTVAVKSFANLMLPSIIPDNADSDSADLEAWLQAAHREGKVTVGLCMKKGTMGDMAILSITESF